MYLFIFIFFYLELSNKILIFQRFEKAMEIWEKAAGGKRPTFGNATYLSEKDTCDRNYAIGYLMVSFSFFLLLLFNLIYNVFFSFLESQKSFPTRY